MINEEKEETDDSYAYEPKIMLMSIGYFIVCFWILDARLSHLDH